MGCRTNHSNLMNIIKLLPVIIRAAPLYASSSTGGTLLESSFANEPYVDVIPSDADSHAEISSRGPTSPATDENDLIVTSSLNVQDDGGDTDQSNRPSRMSDALHRGLTKGQETEESLHHRNIFAALPRGFPEREGLNLGQSSESPKVDYHQVRRPLSDSTCYYLLPSLIIICC